MVQDSIVEFCRRFSGMHAFAGFDAPRWPIMSLLLSVDFAADGVFVIILTFFLVLLIHFHYV